ncbi:hypothetical protein [Glutamicibacter sp. NPDC087344]|uniref:hypothetical protein n=1 Tax=Glutamicibacter sp. NPDC087344 TaxID=3363994 RepID=UPI0038104AEB
MHHPTDGEPDPPPLRYFKTSRTTRKWIAAALVASTMFLIIGITAAVHDDHLYLGGLMKQSKTVTATVLSQDLDDCSLLVRINGAEQVVQNTCAAELFAPNSVVQLVADSRVPPTDPYFYHVFVSPRQWEENITDDWWIGSITAVILGAVVWAIAYRFMLKPDRRAHVLRKWGIKPTPGRFERLVLALQHAPRRVRYTLLSVCLILSAGSAVTFIADGAKDFRTTQDLVNTQPHLTAKLVAHETSGRSVEPAQVDVADRRMTLSWSAAGQRSMELGEEIDVVIDPRYQGVAIPVDFAQGPDNSRAARWINILIAFFPGGILMAGAFRLLASRQPFEVFEPWTLIEDDQQDPQ